MKNENQKNIYFIYCYLDIRKPGKYIYNNLEFDYEPIYIGKGKGIRAKRHLYLYKNINNRFYSKLSSIIKSGNKPFYFYMEENLSEDIAYEYEIEYINKIGRIENGGPLTNMSDGGRGQYGFIFTEESKEKMSLSRIGEKHFLFGKNLTQETKDKISKSKKGIPSINKGKKLEEIVGEEKALQIKEKISIKASKRVGEKSNRYGINHTEESKELMRKNANRMFGENNFSFGRQRPENEKNYDSWEITNINNDVIIVDNLCRFCKENKLNSSCMRDIYYGRQKKHKEWIKVVKLTNNVKKKKPD